MDHLAAWRRDLERRLKPASVAGYSRDVDALARWAGERLDTLSHREIARWLDARGGDPKTVAAKHSAFRSYFGFLVRMGLRDGNPMDRVDRPRVLRGSPRTIPDAHHRIAKLGEPYRRIAELIYETGMTKAEAFAVDVHGHQIGDEVFVDGRLVRLTEPAKRALLRLDGRIARANGMSPRSVERRFREKGLTARGLRHTFADELVEQGADLETIAEALGLSLASARMYARGTAPVKDRVREALERRIRAR